MSKEREVNTPSGFTKTLTNEDILSLSGAQLDAHVAAILDRGLTNARLKVNLPPDMHGEWVHNDPQSIYEKQLLGFQVDTEYALKHALNNDGSGSAIIGDVIHMIAPMRLMEAIDRKRRLDFQARHGKDAGRKKKQIEEQGFLSRNHGGLEIINDSAQDSVGLNTIIDAVSAAKKENNQ